MKGYCYIWEESEGDLNNTVFVYIQYRHHGDLTVHELQNTITECTGAKGADSMDKNVSMCSAKQGGKVPGPPVSETLPFAPLWRQSRS